MVARGLSCVMAGLMIGGIAPASAASAFNVESLPQVSGLTTFSVTSSSNDVHCDSTSMDAVSTDKYIQVCGETTTVTTAAPTTTTTTTTTTSTTSTTSTTLANGGGGSEEPAPEEGGGGARKAPQGLRKLAASESDSTTSTVAPPQENSYIQLMNKSKFGMLKRTSATPTGTVFESVTSYDDTTILVSTADSKTLTAYDATELTVKNITLPTTGEPSSRTGSPLTLEMEKAPRSIAWDKTEKKLYATDGETNKIYVFDSSLTKQTPIEVSCGKEGTTTTHLGDITYVKPYLYIAIEGTSNIIRVDTANGKCDTTWLIDFSTYQDASFTEADKKISSFSMDKSVTEYTGKGFPKMMIAGDKWNHIYELSKASSYVVSSFVIFAITAITSIFSS